MHISAFEAYSAIFDYPSVQQILAPYYTARFALPWTIKPAGYDGVDAVTNLLRRIQSQRERSLKGMKYFRHYNPEPGSSDWISYKLRQTLNLPWLGSDACPEGTLYDLHFLNAFQAFLEQYKEGAIIALILLMAIKEPRFGDEDLLGKDLSIKFIPFSNEVEFEHYWQFNMLFLPSLVNHEPLEILLTLKKLHKVLPETGDKEVYKHIWICPMFFKQEEGAAGRKSYKGFEAYRFSLAHSLSGFKKGRLIEELRFLEEFKVRENADHLFLEEDLHALNRELQNRTQDLWWVNSEKLVKNYLQLRALDLARYGKNVADRTFPQPSIKGATPKQVEDLVSWMVSVLKEFKQRRQKKYEEKWYAQCKEKVAASFNKRFSNQLIPVPDNLAPRVLSEKDIEFARSICLKELDSSEQTHAMRVVIDNFVQFCTLFSQPENHIQVPTGQYIEKEYNARTVADMENEMASQLINLPKQTAYIKLTQEKAGRQQVLKRQIHTYPLLPQPAGRDQVAFERFILERSLSLYYQKREQIEKEIWQRQQKWLTGILEKPPPADTGNKGESLPSLGVASPEPTAKVSQNSHLLETDEPPATSFSTQTSESGEPPVRVIEAADSEDEKGLIYRTNFYQPDDQWDEGTTHSEYFRQDGYYHIRIRDYGFGYRELKITLADFRLYLDAEFIASNNETDRYGIDFRKEANGSYYEFSISRSGHYALEIYVNEAWRTIISSRFSDLIRRGNNPNSLMIEMIGQKITLGVNGQTLDTAIDNTLASGYFCLYVSTAEDDSVKEIRFRNLRLYSLE